MDTLLFYVENGEKPELSVLTRSRRHSSLTLCSVSRSMYCFVIRKSDKLACPLAAVACDDLIAAILAGTHQCGLIDARRLD